jgi:hypothetical protein
MVPASMFTVGSLFCDFYSIPAVVKGNFAIAATTIPIAGGIMRLTRMMARQSAKHASA